MRNTQYTSLDMSQAYANYPGIKYNSLIIKRDGSIVYNSSNLSKYYDLYKSSNGYLYILIDKMDGTSAFVPLAMVIALTFVQIPDALIDKPVVVKYLDGNKDNCSADNLEWVEDVEEWKDVVYKNIRRGLYQISSWGNVRSIHTGTPIPLSKSIDKHGYYRTSMVNVFGSNTRCPVHRLVATAFVSGKIEETEIVNHMDNIKTHNHYMNLEWVTVQQNNKHASLVGALPLCELNHKALLTNEYVERICNMLNQYSGDVDKVYNILKAEGFTKGRHLISSIKYGVVYSEISDNILTDSGRTKIVRKNDPEIVRDVAFCLKKNEGNVKKTKDELIDKYPWINCGWIWHIKDKSIGKEITDDIFNDKEFEIKQIPISEADAALICETLVKYKDDKHNVQATFNELKDVIHNLTERKIRGIKHKESWVNVSDRYFKKGEF